MSEPKSRLLALSAALLIPHLAVGQVSSRVEAGALVTDATGTSAIPNSVWRVAPAASYRGAHGSLSAATSAWLDNQVWQLVDGSVGGTLVAPTIYGVRAELIGNASRAYDDRSLGSDQVDVQTKINVQFDKHAGVWLGGGVARPWRVMVATTIDLLNGGVWADIGTASVMLTGTSFSYTKVADGDVANPGACTSSSSTIGLSGASDPSSAILPVAGCAHRTVINDANLSGHWNLDRFEFAGEGGHRFGDAADVSQGSRYWVSGSITMWVAPRAAMVIGGGRQPTNPSRGIPARSYASLGMMLAYSPSRNSVPVATATTAVVRSFDVRGAGDGMQKIVVRIGGVESVDVMGDFSDWDALRMVRRGRDTWELTIPIVRGQHEINIRTDGGKWVAPPGLPKRNDMFNGEVGVLIVR